MKKLLALYAWAKSPAGKAWIHRAVTIVLAAYTAAHRAGF